MLLRFRLRQYQTFLAKCWAYIGEDRAQFVGFIVLSVLGAVAEGLSISLFVPLVDSISEKSTFQHIPVLATIAEAVSHFPPDVRIKAVAVLILLTVLARSVLQYYVQYLNIYLPSKIERRLRNESFDCVLRMDLAMINRSKSGEVQNIVQGYPSRIGQVMGYLGNLISNLALLAIYAGLMMLISINLTILSLLFIGVVFYLQRALSSGALRQAGAAVTTSGERLGQVVYEALGGLSLIRLSVATDQVSARQQAATAAQLAAQRGYGRASALITPMFIAMTGILICILLFFASGSDGGRSSGVATVFLFLFLLQRLLAPVSAITFARNSILLHIQAVFDFDAWIGKARSEFQKNGDRQFNGLQNEIRFNSVQFSYDQESGDVINDLSFVIPKGKMTALVGPSGAGKSTIVAMLGRLYDPGVGSVEVDGVDLRDYKVDTWRRKLSVVSQSIFLLNDTVERNLTFGINRDVSVAELRRAAELAACNEFIDNLPDGYQTLLGERGVRLSGGQQQRLAIARAILTDPELLILDEATSNLDSITEYAIQRALVTFGKGRTLVAIAHRLATIKRADNIIVLEGGQVIEQGRHGELIALRGRYWAMVEHQRLDIVDVSDESPV